jgi:hypothetical protein
MCYVCSALPQLGLSDSRAVITATTKPVIICRRRNMLVPNHSFVMLSNTGPNK